VATDGSVGTYAAINYSAIDRVDYTIDLYGEPDLDLRNEPELVYARWLIARRVPEPSTIALWVTGLFGLGFAHRRAIIARSLSDLPDIIYV